MHCWTAFWRCVSEFMSVATNHSESYILCVQGGSATSPKNDLEDGSGSPGPCRPWFITYCQPPKG